MAADMLVNIGLLPTGVTISSFRIVKEVLYGYSSITNSIEKSLERIS